MFRIDVRLGDKSEWAKMLETKDLPPPDERGRGPASREYTVFIKCSDPPDVGDPVRADLILGPGGPRVILRGHVVSRRIKADSALLRGFTMKLPTEEREKVSYLNGFVRGGFLDLRERRRLPLRFSLVFDSHNGPVSTHTRDINEEGMFVVTEHPLVEGSHLKARLTVPVRNTPIEVDGIVAYTVVVEDEDVPGMGVRLQFADDAAKKQFSDLVDELELLFVENRLDESCLL